MKQKYTIIIGDVEMNVISEEAPESVEKIVGHVDRKIREINLKSARCSKHEAALLCALDYCTEKLSLQSQLNELESQNDKLFRALERLQRENEKLGESLDLERSRTRELTTALEEAQVQAAQAQAKAQAAAAAAVAAGAGSPVTIPATVPLAVTVPAVSAEDAEVVNREVPSAVSESDSAGDESESADPAAVSGVSAAQPQADPTSAQELAAAQISPVGNATAVDHIARKKKTYSYRSAAAARAKNKVGNMFETLTFHDDE